MDGRPDGLGRGHVTSGRKPCNFSSLRNLGGPNLAWPSHVRPVYGKSAHTIGQQNSAELEEVFGNVSKWRITNGGPRSQSTLVVWQHTKDWLINKSTHDTAPFVHYYRRDRDKLLNKQILPVLITFALKRPGANCHCR